MNRLMRTNPYSLLDEFNRLLYPLHLENDKSKGAMSEWQPSVDIKETPSEFVLLADLPGVKPENIEVSMENNVLSLKGTRHSSLEEIGENWSRTERVQGSFFRQFTLPESADSENIKAKSKHGVLELTIPKLEKPKSKLIQINVED